MAKDFSHAAIKARTLGGRATSSRDRTRMVAAGNPDVIREAEGQPANPRYRSGPAWNEGFRARPVDHHPGKQDTPDIGRGPVITK
jgi:hypothetical protein